MNEGDKEMRVNEKGCKRERMGTKEKEKSRTGKKLQKCYLPQLATPGSTGRLELQTSVAHLHNALGITQISIVKPYCIAGHCPTILLPLLC